MGPCHRVAAQPNSTGERAQHVNLLAFDYRKAIPIALRPSFWRVASLTPLTMFTMIGMATMTTTININTRRMSSDTIAGMRVMKLPTIFDTNGTRGVDFSLAESLGACSPLGPDCSDGMSFGRKFNFSPACIVVGVGDNLRV